MKDGINSYEELFKDFNEANEFDGNVLTRAEYLMMHQFEIWTYDSELDEKFCGKIIDVLVAITRNQTFDYIKEEQQYYDFIMVCAFPFVAEKINWGTSIRGCWLEKDHQLIEAIIRFYLEDK